MVYENVNMILTEIKLSCSSTAIRFDFCLTDQLPDDKYRGAIGK